jgi:hypothetical protein
MVALGLADRPDLLLAAAAHRDDKNKLNDICDQAKEAAKASASATTGTALHALTEQHDRGQTLGVLPADAKADLDAYIAATEPFEHLGIEEFVVHDGFKIGGTFDRLVRYNGEVYIADLKTGSVDFGIGKIAMQLAVYAHSVRYDPATHLRSSLPVSTASAPSSSTCPPARRPAGCCGSTSPPAGKASRSPAPPHRQEMTWTRSA